MQRSVAVISHQTFTCSKSIVEAVKIGSKVTIKTPKRTSATLMTSFWYLNC